MLNLEINLPEIKKFVKELPALKEEIFEMLHFDQRKVASSFLNTLMNCEISLFLGREKYERQQLISSVARNYRNGFYCRSFCIKGVGSLSLKVPRDRLGKYQSEVLPRYERMDSRIKGDVVLMYLLGMSTRNLALVSERMFGKKLSHAEVSALSQEMGTQVEVWRCRPIKEKMIYLYLDGTNFDMRIDDEITKVCVLVVIGVDEDHKRHVLALQEGDKESAGNWRELFKDLKTRGMDPNSVQLGIMDGLPGLEKVFCEEFAQAGVQRCQVHLARNILCKVPAKLKKQVADDLRSIFYATNKANSKKYFHEFEKKWKSELPSALSCLQRSYASATRFYDFPEDLWQTLRTTNPIERLNKEFKRRTKSMEIVAGEQSCYNLLAVVAIRMEAFWRKSPLKLHKNLPWMQTH